MAEPAVGEWETLKEYVGASDSDDAFLETCWAEANALVTSHVGATKVPDAVLHRAFLECGSELFHRRQAPNGVAQFAAFDGAAIRVARDPMVGVYPILRPFLGMGFA